MHPTLALWRVSLHEAGHATVAFLRGHRVGLTSVEAVGPLRGFCEVLATPGQDALLAAIDAILVRLSGGIAEELAGPISGYIAQTPDEEEAERAATESLAALSAEDRAFFVSLDDGPAGRSD